MLLAGDIGGTKTDLAIYAPETGPRNPLFQKRYFNAHYSGLEEIVNEFLANSGLEVTHACFDVAGPVVAGTAKLTNLLWELSETSLQQSLNLKAVKLLNDLEAIAYAIPHLGESDLHTLNKGEPVPNGNLAIIAPGTGLGEAFLSWDGFRYRPHSSEGGHANFGPTNPLELGLLSYLWQKYDHVSYERVCSGIGIPNIYDYLKDTGYAAESPEIEAQFAAAADRTRLISLTAQDPAKSSKLCTTALEMFVSILGTESSNLVLKVWATGGVYLGGGIPGHILPALETGAFISAFRHKGRFGEMLAKVPIQVIVTSAAMIGVASYGLEMALPL
jgi:glucokinase